MAKAALETVVPDAQLRASGESFGLLLGAARDSVPCRVSVGIMDSVPELLDTVAGYVAEGYGSSGPGGRTGPRGYGSASAVNRPSTSTPRTPAWMPDTSPDRTISTCC
jgi:hypothetical protein